MAIAAIEIKEAAHYGVLGGGKNAWVVGRLCYASGTPASSCSSPGSDCYSPDRGCCYPGGGWSPLEGGRSAPGGGCSSLERCPGGSTRTAGDAVEGE